MCELCDAYNEKFRFICESEHAFCVICKWPIKKGHVIVMPKKCVSQLNIHELNPEEMHDFMCLVQTMEDVLNKLGEEDVMTFKNSGKHSSQTHFHIHLIPSKSDLRKLFTLSEGTERRKESLEDEDLEVRDLIREKFYE